jgi:hypothetical protein
MLNQIENNNATSNNATESVLPIQILIAESDPAEIDRLRANIDREFRGGITIANSYEALLVQITQQRPHLVLLGRIDKFNYFEICQECRQVRAKLEIVLLSSQEIITDSFRQLVKTCGLTDVITKDPANLNQLLQKVGTSSRHQPTNDPLDPLELWELLEPLEPLEPLKPLELQQPLKPLELQQPLEPLEPQQPTIGARMMLAGLEEIVEISNNYFGPLAQGNYWRKAHARSVDEFPFIQNWSADHFSKLSCHESILERELTDKDIQSLRIWVQIFIEECERIIVDFGAILHDSALSPLAKDLLITSNHNHR